MQVTIDSIVCFVIILRAHLIVILVEVFLFEVFSVIVKNTFMIIRKDSKVFLIIYCINIKTFLILINYQKGHTILIKKMV